MKRFVSIIILILFLVQYSFAIFCPACGKENPDEAKYCINCGRVIAKDPENTQKIIIEPQTFQDKLSLLKYADWKTDIQENKISRDSIYFLGGFMAIFGFGGAFFPNNEEVKGSEKALGILAGVGGIFTIIHFGGKYNQKIEELKDVGREKGWSY